MQRQEQKNKRMSSHVRHAICYVLLSLLTISTAHANIKDIYTVKEIKVDEQAENATDARKKALEKSQEDALLTLLKRLTATSSHFYLKDLEVDNIANMVQKIEIKDEKITKKRYRADVSISFNPEYIRAILRDNNIPFMDKVSPTTVLVPIYHKGQKIFLWEPHNEWKRNIEERVNNKTLLDIVIPLGDLEDLRYTVNNMRYGDYQQLKSFAKKYNAQDIIILEAKDSPRRVQVEMRKLTSEAEKHQVLSIIKDPQLNDLSKAAEYTLTKLEDSWKTQKQQAATETLTLAVTVPVSSLKEWLAIKKRITKLPFLQNVNIKELTASEVNIHIEYRGGLDMLLAKLNEYNFYLIEKNNKLLLQSAT